MEVTECRYRGRVIGWLVEGVDGFLRYLKSEPTAPVRIEWADGRSFNYYPDDGRWEAA